MILTTLGLMVLLRIPQVIVERRNSVHSPGDISGHLLIHEAMRDLGVRGADHHPRFVFDGSGYPASFHWFCSKVFRSEKAFLRYGFFIPLFADATTVLLAASIGWQLGANNWSWLLLFAVSPILWSNAARASHINERAFGSLFGNLFMISMVFFLAHPSVMAGLGLVVGMSIVSTSSKFTLQAVAFVSLLYSLLSLDVTPILLAGLSWAIANLFLGGYPKTVLKGLVSHSRSYFQHLMKKKLETARNFPLEILLFWRTKGQLTSNWIARALYESPLHLAVLGHVMISFQDVDSWMLLSLSSLMVSFIISLPKLTFLGEGYRYLEIGLVASFLFLALKVDNSVVLVSLMVLYSLMTVRDLVLRTLRRSKSGHLSDQSYAELRAHFSSYPRGKALSVPGRLSIFLGRCNPEIKHLWPLSHIVEGEAGAKFFGLLGDRYPYPIMDVPAIYEIEPFDLLVLDAYGAPDWASYAEHSEYLSKLWSNGRFHVYQHNGSHALGHKTEVLP